MRARKKTAAPLPDVLQARAPGPAPAVDGLVFVPGPEDAGLRLDVFLAGVLAGRGLSREKIKQCIKDGRVSLDGEPCSSPRTPVRPGCRVAVGVPEAVSRLTPEEGELTVLYQDRFLAVINKPAGLTVHPCPSCPQGTLAHRLAARFPSLAAMEGFRPGIVHRLDKDTSGLMVAALNEEARLALSRAFAERGVRKEYLALARGVPSPAEGEIRVPIGRHPTRKIMMAVVPENRGGRAAHSRYTTLYADPGGRFSLLKVRIFTGRTHQIRVHLAHLGLPLWGDALYGTKSNDPAPRQMLHAHALAFPHPAGGGEIALRSPPPSDFLRTALALSRRTRLLVIVGAPGSGKSSFLRLWAEAGLPAFSADAAVHKLYDVGGDGRLLLKQRFGGRFVPDDKAPVDRAALMAALRAEPGLFRELEDLIHPLVRHELHQFRLAAEQAGADAAAAEIPLYLESGRSSFDEAFPAPLLVGVRCDDAVRRARLEASRGLDAGAQALLDARQWPQERKLAACDCVIDNSGPPEALPEQMHALLTRLEQLRAQEEQALAARLAALWT